MNSDESIHMFENRRNSEKKKIYNIKCNITKIILAIITGLFIAFLLFYCFLLINLNKIFKKNSIKENISEFNKSKIEEIEGITNSYIIPRNITNEVIEYDKSLRKIEDKEILEFRKLNSKNIWFERDYYTKSKNPDVTVILLMKNQAHCIHKTLRSIQNQSLKNIEILIMIDCSTDNSTKTIQNYMKEDERIVMVDHDTIEGTMKIRCEGIRLAKGKYITQIDGDDAFIQKDILKNSLYIANLGDLDIVEFYALEYRGEKRREKIHFHSNEIGIIHQPELRTKYINIKENQEAYRPIRCRNIWGKLVKKEVFMKALDNIGSKYTDDYIINFEDTILRLSLFEVAQSYYLIKQQPGYYYSRFEYVNKYPALKNKKCKTRDNVIKGIDPIKFLNYIMEKFKDNEFENQAIFHEILSIKFYEYDRLGKVFKKGLVGHYDMFYNILDKIAKSKYLTEKEIQKINEIKNDIKKDEEKSKKI